MDLGENLYVLKLFWRGNQRTTTEGGEVRGGSGKRGEVGVEGGGQLKVLVSVGYNVHKSMIIL